MLSARFSPMTARPTRPMSQFALIYLLHLSDLTQRRRDAKAANVLLMKYLLLRELCALAPLREIFILISPAHSTVAARGGKRRTLRVAVPDRHPRNCLRRSERFPRRAIVANWFLRHP